MLKHIVLAAFLSGGAVAAYAQPQQAASPPASATVDSKMADSKMAPSATADTRKLIGRNIKNADGETIGAIKSIYINKDGRVDSVMVGVGGFLGVGELVAVGSARSVRRGSRPVRRHGTKRRRWRRMGLHPDLSDAGALSGRSPL